MTDPPRTGSRLDPWVAWTYLTDAPLAGLSLAREAGTLLAWDEADQLQLIDTQGEQVNAIRAPGKILAADYSDDGSLIALLIAGPRLLLLDQDFAPIADRPAIHDGRGLTVDPHGRYIAVASSIAGKTQLYTAYGKLAGSFETLQPLAHLRFVPGRPVILGASAHGSVFGIALESKGAGASFDCEEVWRGNVMSKIGRLETTGDGGIVLASCFTHGIQRFDSRGRNEGAYHLGGTASHAVPDYPGRVIAVATTEGELCILNNSGNVRWKTGLPRGPAALECDALGRFVVYGLPSGEVVRLNLEGGGARSKEVPPPRGGAGRSSALREPAWALPIATTEDQAETAVLAVLEDPPRIAVITNRNQLQLVTASGGILGEAPKIIGVGRILRTAPGWVVAATDRQVVLYDARRNVAERLDAIYLEITHLKVQPDTYGLAIVQERDRLGRATSAGRWVWTRELRSAVEDLAIGPDASTAVTTDDGQLLVFDAAGEPAGSYSAEPPEGLALVSAPSGAPVGVSWVTLARQAQILCGHRPDGRVAWRSPIPWVSWQLHGLETHVVVEALDGRALAFDGAGHPCGQGRGEDSTSHFYADAQHGLSRVTRQGENLLCAEITGKIRWRAIAREPIGPIAAGRPGVAAMIGRSLCWFPESEDA